jgi:hypothetical protein
VLRLVRFIRQMTSNKLIKATVEAAVLSVPQVANIFVILFLALSIFAIIVVSTYGTTKSGFRLSPTASFATFPNAMLTLYQMMFGDEWMEIMDDCRVQYPECTPVFPGHTYGDCGSSFAPLYFVLFFLVCKFTTVNLFVGMVINNFLYCTNRDNLGGCTEGDLEFLREIWTERFDRKGTAFLPLSQVCFCFVCVYLCMNVGTCMYACTCILCSWYTHIDTYIHVRAPLYIGEIKPPTAWQY